MENQVRNKTFLDLIDVNTKNKIITSIANHYGTSENVILDELTNNDEAEHLLDYMVEPTRTEASNLMIKNNLRGF